MSGISTSKRCWTSVSYFFEMRDIIAFGHAIYNSSRISYMLEAVRLEISARFPYLQDIESFSTLSLASNISVFLHCFCETCKLRIVHGTESR